MSDIENVNKIGGLPGRRSEVDFIRKSLEELEEQKTQPKSDQVDNDPSEGQCDAQDNPEEIVDVLQQMT